MLRNTRTCQGIAFNHLGKCKWKTLDKQKTKGPSHSQPFGQTFPKLLVSATKRMKANILAKQRLIPTELLRRAAKRSSPGSLLARQDEGNQSQPIHPLNGKSPWSWPSPIGLPASGSRARSGRRACEALKAGRWSPQLRVGSAFWLFEKRWLHVLLVSALL